MQNAVQDTIGHHERNLPKMVAINRHGWSDKTEVATSGTKEIEIIYDIPKVDNET